MAVRLVLLKVSNADLLVVIRDWYTKYLDLKVKDQANGRYVFLTGGVGAQLAFHVGQPVGDPEAISLYIEVNDVDRLYTRSRWCMTSWWAVSRTAAMSRCGLIPLTGSQW